MAVGEAFSGTLHPVPGVRLSAVESHIRYANRLDLVLIELDVESTVAGVYTQNAFCAAPVHIAKRHEQQGAARYFLINTGNANAGTGAVGEQDALACCDALAELTGVEVTSVLPFSTGVIGERLPAAKILQALPAAIAALSDVNWLAAARGIMTTDTRPKTHSVRFELEGKPVTITGIAKGAGMLKPNMATMLAYVATDAKIDKGLLQSLLKCCVNRSFNRLTVDGDTSTNDCCMLAATGKSGVKVTADGPNYAEFLLQLEHLFVELATGLIKDAEGATKFITLTIQGGRSSDECLAVAYAVAESPLVKTAMFASDPNWGRILAAIGRSGLADFDIAKVSLHLGDTCLIQAGALHSGYTESAGQVEMDKLEIDVAIDIGRGDFAETVWTCDLSNEYVRINADYRS
ncbi:MAG: glutamate N-acetyltransferase/amino-acid N-acetyltransferase [Pseudohongiellaceae bacterium]|jgi:glutamate N-acetyltransferase/amino-acid N-acetyltransferase